MTAAVKPFYRRRPILAGVMALLGLILLLAGAAAIALVTVDFRPFLERRLSRTLDRPVQIGAFQIHWGDPLQVELHDLHVANAGWGSSPDLISVRDVTAALDLRDLLAGRLYFRKLMIAEPIIVLERNAERIGNWRFASSLKTGAAPSIDRAHFPTLLDFTLQGGKITYRTSSGHILQIDLAQATIRTTDDDQPVLLAASGAYNGAALALRAQLQSFRDFRQADKPFGTDLVLSRQTAGLHFAGTMIDPLNVDGAEGPIDLKAARLNDFLSAFGTKLAINPAVDLTGRLKRDGSLWNLMAVKGELGGNALAGQARLQEGARGQPDDIAVEASFKTLDLGNLLATGAQQKESAGGTDWLDQRLDTPDKTAPRLAANLVAEHVSYGGLTFDDVDLATRLAPGEIKLENSRASFAGIRLHLGGGLTPATEGGRLAASLMLDQADAATLV
ncbi:MAG TPA: AsmA family protein, partial [Dongiaceae bacterium]